MMNRTAFRSVRSGGCDKGCGLKSGLMACYQSDVSLGKGDPQINAYWKTWKDNARCVDLNRNFDCGWEIYRRNDRSRPAAVIKANLLLLKMK